MPTSPLLLRKLASILALPLRASSARRAARWPRRGPRCPARERFGPATSCSRPAEQLGRSPRSTATYFPSEARLIAIAVGARLERETEALLAPAQRLENGRTRRDVQAEDADPAARQRHHPRLVRAPPVGWSQLVARR